MHAQNSWCCCMNEREWTGPVRTCTCKPHTDRRHQLGGWCCAIVLSTACAHTCCRQSISMGRLAGWLGPDFLMSLYQSRCGTFPAQGCCCCRKQHCCPVMLMFADVYCLLDYGRSLSLLSPLSCACCCCLSAAALLLLCLDLCTVCSKGADSLRPSDSSGISNARGEASSADLCSFGRSLDILHGTTAIGSEYMHNR
jgi:hypothetical protein